MVAAYAVTYEVGASRSRSAPVTDRKPGRSISGRQNRVTNACIAPPGRAQPVTIQVYGQPDAREPRTTCGADIEMTWPNSWTMTWSTLPRWGMPMPRLADPVPRPMIGVTTPPPARGSRVNRVIAALTAGGASVKARRHTRRASARYAGGTDETSTRGPFTAASPPSVRYARSGTRR